MATTSAPLSAVTMDQIIATQKPSALKDTTTIQVLNFCKNLATEVKNLREEITKLQEKNIELTTKITENNNNNNNKSDCDIWKGFMATDEIKKGISNVVSSVMAVEQCKTQRKEKSLIITEKFVTGATRKLKKGTSEAVVKEAVKTVFEQISMAEHVESAKLSRFSEDGPIVVLLDCTETKFKILKAARKLMETEYKVVYINQDRTKMEVEREKALKVEQREKNAKLSRGEGHAKHELEKRGEVECKWYWGIRNWELKKIYVKVN
jgi:hypothetical protein